MRIESDVLIDKSFAAVNDAAFSGEMTFAAVSRLVGWLELV